jgi:hypothetical protein
MRIIKGEKGTPYFQLETDIAAILSGNVGDKFLDNDNCLKHDIEIHFIKKRG